MIEIKKISLFLLTSLLFLLTSCMYDINGSNPGGEENNLTFYRGYFSSMGTVIELQLYAPNQIYADKVFVDIKSIYAIYDSISDDGYDSIYGQSDDSELALLNNNRSMKVSDELYNLLQFAIYMQEETNGYFNPFMGELNHEWKDYINYTGLRPSDTEIMYFLNIANNTYLEFGDDNLVTIKNDITENTALIDLGGIAKGYATNVCYKYLEKNNIKHYLLNAGSSNILTGSKPSEDAYDIVLSYVYNYPYENPKIEIIDGIWFIDGYNTNLLAFSNAKSYYGNTLPSSEQYNDGDLYLYLNNNNVVVYIKDAGQWKNKLSLGLARFSSSLEAIVTSSPAEQHRIENNIYYHHLISPKTGYPENFVDSVTVLGNDSGYLDALSTALYVMPDDIRNNYINEHNLKVIVSKNGNIVFDSSGKEL